MGQGKGLGQLDLTPYAGSTKTTSCPQGHMLTLWRAGPGQCDQCFRKVQRGEHVMDCRACEFFLCSECRPLTRSGRAEM